jgi:hypothetical protein
MKAIVLFVLTAIAGLAAAAAAGASAPAHAASSPPCLPKITTSGGHTVVEYCGPATATVKVDKKTYSFKNGFCSTDTAAHFPLKITLGLIDSSKSSVNGGQPLLELNDLQTGGLSLSIVIADFGGKVLTNGSVKLKGSIPEDGTFTSSGAASPSISGTWDCNHVVVAEP